MSNIVGIQSIIENQIDLSQARTMLIFHKGEYFTFFDEGTSRHVFVNKDETKVIKILKTNNTNFNKDEFKIYSEAEKEDKKQMVETTIFNGVIEQKFVTPIKFGGIKLNEEQSKFARSCRNEVGWDEKRKLVCFDLDEFKKY